MVRPRALWIGSALLGAAAASPVLAQTIDRGPIYNPNTQKTYIRTTPATWTQQEAFAQSIGGHLVTIASYAENLFVNQTFLGPPSNTVLIGLNDAAVEGQYVWASGEPGLVIWGVDEPNNGGPGGNEDYVQMYPIGLWNDVGAGFAAPGVIEFTSASFYGAVPVAVPSVTTFPFRRSPPGLGEAPCEGVSGGGQWYRFSVPSDAVVTVDLCQGSTFQASLRIFTGDLPVLSCIDSTDSHCTDSGWPRVTFIAAPNRTYYALVGSFAGPSDPESFTLSVSSAPVPTVSVVARSEINAGRRLRYYILNTGNYFQLDAVARSYGMLMASVGSADENALVRSFMNRWVGVSSAYWIGLTSVYSPGVYQWADGAPVTYTNWAVHEPRSRFTFVMPDALWWTDSGTSLKGIAEAPLTAQPGGHIRGSLEFHGADALVVQDDFLTWPSPAITIETWFRTTTSGVILGQFGTPGGFVPMMYVGADGLLRAAEWSGTLEGSLVTSTARVDDGVWRHVAYVRDGSNVTLYIDGAPVAQRTTTLQGYAGSYAYRIGTGRLLGWVSPGNDHFIGELDELRIWSVARSGAEIRATKDSRYFDPENYPGPLGVSMDFDDAGSRVAWDSSIYRRNGTFEGSPTWRYEDRNHDKVIDACQPRCLADIDGNGVVNSTDVSAFINMWFEDQAGAVLNADFNRDGVSNSTDVSDMINAYFEAGAGCV